MLAALIEGLTLILRVLDSAVNLFCPVPFDCILVDMAQLRASVRALAMILMNLFNLNLYQEECCGLLNHQLCNIMWTRSCVASRQLALCSSNRVASSTFQRRLMRAGKSTSTMHYRYNRVCTLDRPAESLALLAFFRYYLNSVVINFHGGHMGDL